MVVQQSRIWVLAKEWSMVNRRSIPYLHPGTIALSTQTWCWSLPPITDSAPERSWKIRKQLLISNEKRSPLRELLQRQPPLSFTLYLLLKTQPFVTDGGTILFSLSFPPSGHTNIRTYMHKQPPLCYRQTPKQTQTQRATDTTIAYSRVWVLLFFQSFPSTLCSFVFFSLFFFFVMSCFCLLIPVPHSSWLTPLPSLLIAQLFLSLTSLSCTLHAYFPNLTTSPSLSPSFALYFLTHLFSERLGQTRLVIHLILHPTTTSHPYHTYTSCIPFSFFFYSPTLPSTLIAQHSVSKPETRKTTTLPTLSLQQQQPQHKNSK